MSVGKEMADRDQKAWQAWCQRRHDELAGPDSWLGLAGLYWLEEGGNSVGSATECTVRLPGGPAYLGELHLELGTVVWRPVEGTERELATDRDGEPTAVDHENSRFFIVDREGRLAARVRDRAWAASLPFAGVQYFEFDPAWQIAADWQSIDPPLSMEVPNVSGDLKMVEVAHKAVFEVAGQVVELLPMSVGEREVFFVFRDRTSGRETYGAGRFLKASAAVDGKIDLDFNCAYNPPCAFTPFATCPLPPPENWLPFAVPVGERKWEKPYS